MNKPMDSSVPASGSPRETVRKEAVSPVPSAPFSAQVPLEDLEEYIAREIGEARVRELRLKWSSSNRHPVVPLEHQVMESVLVGLLVEFERRTAPAARAENVRISGSPEETST